MIRERRKCLNRDYDALLKAGNQAQIEKLKKNEHKKGFDNIGFTYGFIRLTEELKELEEELICLKHGLNNYETLRSEAADIANFAHMIILACDKELDK